MDFAEASKEAFAIAEFLTITAGNNGSLDAGGFEGAVLVSLMPIALPILNCSSSTKSDLRLFSSSHQAIAGVEDYIVCDGYCPGVYDEPASTYYRNAKPFVPYLHPNASHNFYLHHNATGAYQVITDFPGSESGVSWRLLSTYCKRCMTEGGLVFDTVE